MEDVIAEEAQSLYRRIRQRTQENENNQVAMSRIFSPVACNVIWRFVTGKRSSQDDPELQKLTEAGKHIFRFFEAGSLLESLGWPSFMLCGLPNCAIGWATKSM